MVSTRLDENLSCCSGSFGLVFLLVQHQGQSLFILLLIVEAHLQTRTTSLGGF